MTYAYATYDLCMTYDVCMTYGACAIAEACHSMHGLRMYDLWRLHNSTSLCQYE